jgi:hypothetical protein
MQMFFNGAQNGAQNIPTKSDDIDNGLAPSPWANIISVGLKIVTALLGGGGANNDGIDKVDNGNSPMQVRRDFIETNHSFMFGGRETLHLLKVGDCSDNASD